MDEKMALRVLEACGAKVGEIEIVAFYEDGFTYNRKTEYMKCIGIAEHTSTLNMCTDTDYHHWTCAEVVTERYK